MRQRWVYVAGDRQKAVLWALEYEAALMPGDWTGWWCDHRAIMDTARAGYVQTTNGEDCDRWALVKWAACSALDTMRFTESEGPDLLAYYQLLAWANRHLLIDAIRAEDALDLLGSLPERCFRRLLASFGVIGSLAYTALTVGQSARWLGVTPRQVRRMINQGALPAELVNMNGREVYAIKARAVSDNALRRGIGS